MYSLTEIQGDSISTTSDEDNKLYISNIKNNIKHLESTSWIYLRNNAIAKEYKNYFLDIIEFVKPEYHYPEDLRKHGYELKLSITPNDTIIHFSKIIDADQVLISRQVLADYHNSLLKSKEISMYPIYGLTIGQFIIGHLIEVLFNMSEEKTVIEVTKFKEIDII